jgi:hypothetical protein
LIFLEHSKGPSIFTPGSLYFSPFCSNVHYSKFGIAKNEISTTPGTAESLAIRISLNRNFLSILRVAMAKSVQAFFPHLELKNPGSGILDHKRGKAQVPSMKN